jgi:hypothetical protein
MGRRNGAGTMHSEQQKKKKKSVPSGIFCQTPHCVKKKVLAGWNFATIVEGAFSGKVMVIVMVGSLKKFDLFVASSQNFEITSMTSST